MGINAKTWAPLAAAVVLGGIAAKTGYDIVARRPTAKVIVQNVSRVVVAGDDIPPGTALRPEMLTVSSVAEGSAPAGTFDAADRLTNRVTTVAVRKGQPILDTVLAPEGTSRGLTAMVPEGMRAVTMEINEVSGVAGLIVPGCRVDVVSTFPGDNGQMMTKTICRALQVVAVGHNYLDSPRDTTSQSSGFHENPSNAEPQLARSATLLVTPKEAELIDLAAHTGLPRLVLRSGRDSKKDAGGMDDGVTVAELRDGTKKQAGGWKSFFTSFFSPTASNPGKAPTTARAQLVSDEHKLSDPNNLFGQQPTTQPARSRAVLVIRRTKEETVQVPLDGKHPEHVPQQAPVLVNTDTGEAIPGGVGIGPVGGARRGD